MSSSSGSQVASSDAGAGPPANAQARGTTWNFWTFAKTIAIRMIFTYFVFSMFRQQPSKPSDQAGGDSSQAPSPSRNMYLPGHQFEMYAYLAEESTFSDFNRTDRLAWHLPELTYGHWTAGQNSDGQFVKTVDIDCQEQFPNLMKNGSLYLHVYLVHLGASPDPNQHRPGVDSTFSTVYASKMLTRHKRRRLSRTVNLLTGQTDQHPDLVAKASHDGQSHLPPVTHWHPNLTINLVDDHTAWTEGAVPAPLDQFIHFRPLTNEYYPILYLNDYWNLNEEFQPVNETTPRLHLTLTYAPLSLFKWQLYAAQSAKSKNWFNALLGDASAGFGSEIEQEEEQDTLKKTLLGTNPWLLALTAIVSVVHCVFELLAFKNDIQFWNSRESLEGLSVRSILFNVFQTFIVFLYVLDNHTNLMITMSVLVGLGIEIWKIKKVLSVSVVHEDPWFGFIPRLRIDYQPSYVESDTKTYDQMAFRYLSWVLFPMLFAYCGYSLVYQEHRGWYSWVLSMLYGFFLTFGFIMMTPQLFINYKLKSVAHLPWRMLTYKALNTFIDDLFAFVIHMPFLYRIGCLRDDVIFFIYLYQRWIYPMDPNRLNEFGVSKQMLDKKPDEKDPNQAPSAKELADKPSADAGDKASSDSESTSTDWEVVNNGVKSGPDQSGNCSTDVRRRSVNLTAEGDNPVDHQAE